MIAGNHYSGFLKLEKKWNFIAVLGDINLCTGIRVKEVFCY